MRKPRCNAQYNDDLLKLKLIKIINRFIKFLREIHYG